MPHKTFGHHDFHFGISGTASTSHNAGKLGQDAVTPGGHKTSPMLLNEPVNDFQVDLQVRMVPSSSASMRRLYPWTSALRMVASLRFRLSEVISSSPLKVNLHSFGSCETFDRAGLPVDSFPTEFNLPVYLVVCMVRVVMKETQAFYPGFDG